MDEAYYEIVDNNVNDGRVYDKVAFTWSLRRAKQSRRLPEP